MRNLIVALSGALAVVCAAPGALAQAPAGPPIEAYASLPALGNVAISPDGTKIAFIGTAANGVRQLAARTLSGESLGAVGIGDQKVRAVQWADNTHVLITTSDYVTPRGLDSNGEFYNAQSYNTETRRFVTLMNETRGGRGTTSTRIGGSSGQFNFIQGTPFQRMINGRLTTIVYSPGADYRSTPFSIDLDTGVGTPLEDFESVSDANGQPIARDQWDTERGRYWIQAKDTVGWREIWSGDNYLIETPSLLGYGRTTDTVLLAVPEATGEALFEVPLAGGTPRRLGFGDMNEPSPIYHRLTRELIGFSALTDNAYDVVFLDPALAARWASVTAAYPGKTVQVVSATPDFDKIIILTQGPGDAGTYALIDMAAGRAIPLGSQYPAVPAAAMGEVRYITYRAADGMEIPAYLTLPPGREARNLPLIMLPHGGPGARDEPGFDHWSQLLASRGYAVLQPQFRGSTGYGTAHLEAGYGQWGRKMQSDLTDGVHYLRDQGIADPERVCIFGWSYGGYAAMAGATLDPETYRCSIAGAGVSDLPRMLAWERDQTGGKDTIVMRFWKRFMGAERINDNSIAQVSPARLADRVQGPVLLIHGRDDSVVPYEQSELFQRALERAGKDVEMVELRGEDHWLSRASGRLRVSQALIDFLQRHNPPD